MDIREYTLETLLGPLNDVELKNAPERLFVAGDTEILKVGARVSIVGSRKASAAGKQRAGRLAKLLAERGIVVVSGLAEGIDTAAHTSSIEDYKVAERLALSAPRSTRCIRSKMRSCKTALCESIF